jgi:hypothetical protein
VLTYFEGGHTVDYADVSVPALKDVVGLHTMGDLETLVRIGQPPLHGAVELDVGNVCVRYIVLVIAIYPYEVSRVQREASIG